MGYELIWQPFKNGWAVWSTVVDAFVAEGIRTPEGVADYILGDREFYYTGRYETDLRGKTSQTIATARFKSAGEITDYYTRLINEAQDIHVKVLTKQGWVEEVTPAEQVKINLNRAFAVELEKWDSGTTRPNPQAREDLRKEWIEEAERVKREGVLTISGIQVEITEQGLEYRGEITKGPEVW